VLIEHLSHDFEQTTNLEDGISKLRIYQLSLFATVCLLKLECGEQLVGVYVSEAAKPETKEYRAKAAYDVAMDQYSLYRMGLHDDHKSIAESYLAVLDDLDQLRRDIATARATNMDSESIADLIEARLTDIVSEHDGEPTETLPYDCDFCEGQGVPDWRSVDEYGIPRDCSECNGTGNKVAL
jgi:hypothetical protein